MDERVFATEEQDTKNGELIGKGSHNSKASHFSGPTFKEELRLHIEEIGTGF